MNIRRVVLCANTLLISSFLSSSILPPLSFYLSISSLFSSHFLPSLQSLYFLFSLSLSFFPLPSLFFPSILSVFLLFYLPSLSHSLPHSLSLSLSLSWLFPVSTLTHSPPSPPLQGSRMAEGVGVQPAIRFRDPAALGSAVGY